MVYFLRASDKTMSDTVPYASIDPLLERWVEEHSLSLFKTFGDREARFVYISSNDGECFQISIEPPQEDSVTVNAWTVETLDDRELHQEWKTPTSDLYGVLQASLAAVRNWFLGRQRDG
jgi:hypothetical protein